MAALALRIGLPSSAPVRFIVQCTKTLETHAAVHYCALQQRSFTWLTK
jgi:hypothetical protein